MTRCARGGLELTPSADELAAALFPNGLDPVPWERVGIFRR